MSDCKQSNLLINSNTRVQFLTSVLTRKHFVIIEKLLLYAVKTIQVYKVITFEKKKSSRIYITCTILHLRS